MPPNLDPDRVRAARALQRLVGGDAVERYFPPAPVSFRMVKSGLIVVAGDGSRALDPFALTPLAVRHRADILAIWTDSILAGHAFEIDVVLLRNDQTDHYPAYRLWMAVGRRRSLVPARGEGPAIEIAESGLTIAARPPWRSSADLCLGIARGQAWLHDAVYRDTPFANPLDRNLTR